jgi:acyl-homoserine lactone acylase PvdQ
MAGRRVAALALASSAHAQGAGALPDQPVAPSVAGETHVLPGLKAPGRVVVDRWGIAHICRHAG